MRASQASPSSKARAPTRSAGQPTHPRRSAHSARSRAQPHIASSRTARRNSACGALSGGGRDPHRHLTLALRHHHRRRHRSCHRHRHRRQQGSAWTMSAHPSARPRHPRPAPRRPSRTQSACRRSHPGRPRPPSRHRRPPPHRHRPHRPPHHQPHQPLHLHPTRGARAPERAYAACIRPPPRRLACIKPSLAVVAALPAAIGSDTPASPTGTARYMTRSCSNAADATRSTAKMLGAPCVRVSARKSLSTEPAHAHPSCVPPSPLTRATCSRSAGPPRALGLQGH